MKRANNNQSEGNIRASSQTKMGRPRCAVGQLQMDKAHSAMEAETASAKCRATSNEIAGRYKCVGRDWHIIAEGRKGWERNGSLSPGVDCQGLVKKNKFSDIKIMMEEVHT